MRIVIFGGTTEGRELSKTLAAEGADVTVSVATQTGVEEQGPAEGITIARGKKDEGEIRDLIRGADVVVDATHPYAVLVSENIRQAAQKENVELLRLVRASGIGQMQEAGGPDASDAEDAGSCADGPDIRIAADTADAAKIALEIAGPEGHVLLTTGSKDLAAYAEVIDPEHLYARVLPMTGSIELCEQAKIPHRNIIAVQGPFSEELNQAVIRDYGIDVMITKESGRAGGFLEKIRACGRCGIPAVVIARPSEEGLSFDEVLAECRNRLQRRPLETE